MTEHQLKRLYFPRWNRAAEAQDWRMERKRFVGRQVAHYGGPETNALYQRIWQIASALARADSRAVHPDDFRHALNAMAVQRAREYRCGKEVRLDLSERATSSRRLEDIELDLALALFALLVDADSLDAILTWLHPENAERRRLVWFIEKFPHAYVQAIAADTAEGRDWWDLTIMQLRNLALTLSRRAKRPTRPPPPPCHVSPPELDEANAPF